MNTVDRSGPRYDLVDDAAEFSAPVAFPFQMCPKNGWFTLSPSVTYTPGVIRSEFLVRGLSNRNVMVPLVMEDSRGIAISPTHIMRFGDGWDSAQTHTAALLVDPNILNLNEQTVHMFRIEVPDANNVNVKIFDYGTGKLLANSTLTFTGMFSGNPTFVVGHPTDAQMVGLAIAGFTPSPDITILAQQSANAGPTAVSVSPAVATTAAEVGYWVGNLWATHARAAALPCTFALVAGTGDTNNALFSIRGSNLHVGATLTAGAKSIRVQATDKFGATFAQALTVTVS